MTPGFYEPSQVTAIYVERATLVADAAEAHRKATGIAPARCDTVKIAAFGIDCQIGFCTPGASLFVPGADDDTRRTVEWIYRNIGVLTALQFSLDTHRIFQIFHPAFWADAEGAHPAPFTTVSCDDVRSGRWAPIAHRDACVEYVERLQAQGNYVLTIWPYHTLLGGVSHALVPALMEAAIFHSIARQTPTEFVTKGEHALTENYSVLSPEVRELNGAIVGAFNDEFFRALLGYDRVYVFGQAKSHCVLSTLRDLRDAIVSIDEKLLGKIWILEDAMSPVPAPPVTPLPPSLDFPTIAREAIAELRREGMNVAKTSDVIRI